MKASRLWLAAGLIALAACSKDEKKVEGQFRVVATGGAGAAGEGRGGGDVYVGSYAGGDVAIVKDGAIPTVPSFKWVKPDLGSNPLTISTNQTVTPDGWQRLVGDDGVNAATGLWVKPGATLTLMPNLDWDGVAGADVAYFYVDTGVLIEGTVVLAARNGAGIDASSLYAYASSFVVAKTGRIDASGQNASPGRGGNAGWIQLSSNGSAFNEGTLVAHGGRGVDWGGDGAGVGLYADWGMAINTGTMDASGGDATGGTGGNAGWAEVSVDSHGTALNTGTMRAAGGQGTLGGGSGNWLYVETYDRGPAYSTGALEAPGGDATSDGSGGGAGGVYVEAYGADAFLGGTLALHGGKAAGTGGSGGSGGQVDLYAWDTYGENGRVPAGRVILGADLDLSGGDGTTGGWAGSVDVEAGSEMASEAQPQIQLVGFAAFELSGGRGQTYGGNGGDVYVETYPGYTASGVRMGSILNEVPVTSHGGEGVTEWGASGGDFELYAYGQDGYVYATAATAERGLTSTVVNRGALDLVGAAGVSQGGNGGGVYLSAFGDVRNEAVVRVDGGEGRDEGGAGGYVELYGDASVTSTAALFASGGASADGTGGWGGSAWVYGARASCRDLTANGGASTTATGGHGGDVGIGSAVGTSSLGTLSVGAGAGATAGEAGEAWVDGFQVALTNGTYRR